MKNETNDKNTDFIGVDKNFDYDLNAFVDEVVGFANKIDVKDGLKDLESLWKTIGIDLDKKIRKSEEMIEIKSIKLDLSQIRKHKDAKKIATLENKIADKISEFIIESSVKVKSNKDKKIHYQSGYNRY